MSNHNMYQKAPFEMWIGCVEGRNDPLQLGRVQVRILGYHDEDLGVLPTEDLPWCMPIQSITSAANSGVGSTPLGITNGSWVVGYFLDSADQQLPVFIGTFGSYQGKKQSGPLPIDSKPNTPKVTKEVIRDNGGSPIVTSNIVAPSGWKLGDTSAKYESGGRGPGVINNYNTSNDPGGASYGCYQFASYLPKTRPDGKARPDARKSAFLNYLRQSKFTLSFQGLTPATPEFDAKWKKVAADNTAAFKDDQHEYIQNNFYLVMLANLKQNGLDLSNFGAGVQDLIWSTAVQLGPNALSVFMKPLEGKTRLSDIEIVTLVSDYKIANVTSYFKSSPANIQTSVRNRWSSEKADLLKLCTNAVVPASIEEKETTYGEQYSSGKDTDNKDLIFNSTKGFRDPDGNFPRGEYENQQDTNKLARNVITDTAAEYKSILRAYGLPLPNGDSFDQPTNPYAAEYPYNKVYESESGHVFEVDDTPGCERINNWHMSGTFNEIDANGNQVNRITGSGYTIIDRNGFISISGKANVSVNGSINLFIGGNANIEVDGNTIVNAKNDVIVEAQGAARVSSGEDISLHGKNVYIEAEEYIHVKSGKDIALDTKEKIYLQSNKAKNSLAPFPTEGRYEISEVILDELVPPHRTESEDYLIEAPNDQYSIDKIQAELIAMGTDPEDLKSAPVIEETVDSTETRTIEGSTSTVDTEYLKTLTVVPDTYQLSSNFTLAQLSSKAAATPTKVQAQFGLKVGEIVANLQLLAVYCLEPMKKKYPNMLVTSGFRTYSPGSQHTLGQACDIQIPGLSNADLLQVAKDLKRMVPYDQLIFEQKNTSTGRAWIHISYKQTGNKTQSFTMFNHKVYSQELVLVA